MGITAHISMTRGSDGKQLNDISLKLVRLGEIQ